MNKMAEEVEIEIRKDNSREISSKKIGNIIMRRLKKLDKVAYLRFASVYREFDDLNDFEKEFTKLSGG